MILNHCRGIKESVPWAVGTAGRDPTGERIKHQPLRMSGSKGCLEQSCPDILEIIQMKGSGPRQTFVLTTGMCVKGGSLPVQPVETSRNTVC